MRGEDFGPKLPSEVVQRLAKATATFRESRAQRHDSVRRTTQGEIDRLLAHLETRRKEKESWGEIEHEAAPDPVTKDLHEEAQRLDRKKSWHAARARGHRDRFERVTACGSDKARATCTACGEAHDLPMRCDVWRVCVSCRAGSALERRARFGCGRASTVLGAQRAGLFNRFRRGGRWSEKHMTLTVPHVDATGDRATVLERLRIMFEAWRAFTIALRKHWLKARVKLLRGLGLTGREAQNRARAEQRQAREHYYRFFEWTPGDDLRGHPHFHVWLLCPYLSHAWIASTWAAALRKAGAVFDGDPIVDIREVRTRPHEMSRELLKTRDAVKLSKLQIVGRGGQDVVEYADGWTIVDVAAGDRLGTEILAALYEGLEARRVSQSSVGLLAPHELAICLECGEQGAIVVRMLPPEIEAEEDRQARAPPVS